MKLLSASASLAALLLIAAPAMAQDGGGEEPVVTEGQSGQELPEAVLSLLNDTRAPSELSAGELESRAKQARRFSRDEGLPGDVRDRLQQMAKDARQELISRQQAAEQPAEPETQAQTEEQPQPEVQPEPEAQTQTDSQQAEEQPQPEPEPQQTEAAPAPAELPPEVIALIEDGRPLSELSDAELKERAQRARQLSRSGKLPDDVRARLAGISKEARAEIAAREQASQQSEPAQQDQQAEQPAEQPATQSAEDASKTDSPDASGGEQAAQPQPAPSQEDVKALDSNEASPEFEDKAQAYLQDNTDVTKLSDDELRARLDNIRDVMATNKLSRRTERQVREKLREERRILRSRLAQRQEEERIRKEQQAQEQASATQENQQSQGSTGKADRNEPKVIINNTYITNRTVVLEDRRPSDRLADYELRRRIEVYRDAANDDEYADYDRQYYRATLERDRRLLRQRLIEDRRRRERELRIGAGNDDFNIEVGIDLGRDEPYSAYAAEIDDEELEGILVAAPRREIGRRYTIDEIESSDELRSAIPRIEIDTIRFGFNESFVREEEIDNLDRVGEVIEKVLARHPREVFLIEGHTDAVGSDAYNLRLSRQRAEAVKKALTTYFVIPPENLRTAGYGERYLKIPTADAEQENRRVSVARATDLVGELEE